MLIKKIKTVYKKIPWWNFLICKVFGHIDPGTIKSGLFKGDIIEAAFEKNITITLQISNNKSACIKYKPCVRCGIYKETLIAESFTEDELLTEDEKIIKDIIT
jgi:hypothetical protein